MADGSSFHGKWFTASTLAGLTGLPGTDRGVLKFAHREGWNRRRRQHGKGWEYAFQSLPEVTQAALLLREHPVFDDTADVSRKPRGKVLVKSQDQIESAWDRYERVKTPLKDTAKSRLNTVLAVEKLVSGGMPLMKARKLVASQKKLSAPTIARWQKAVAGVDQSHWLAFLVPNFCGREKKAPMPAEAWDLYRSDWLREEQPTSISCYRRLQDKASEKGWNLPCIKTFERRVGEEIPRAVVVLARYGDEELMKLYPAQERDHSVFSALEAVNADGHRFDVMVRFPDGHVGRPLILGWQDIYSGKMLSWRLTDHESSDVVRLALADLVRNYGIPKMAYLDNGRAFASKWMTGGTPNRYRFKVKEEDPEGVLTTLIGKDNVHWVTPYHGQAKPIERLWRDYADEIAKHPDFAGAYVGNSPTNKPSNYGSKVVEWETFERSINHQIAKHNARTGRTSKVCAGRSFDETFADSYAKAIVRKCTEAQLRMLLMASEAVTANRNDGSVRLCGNRYWTEKLSEYAGKKVVLRVDPYQLHDRAYVYALDGNYICEAPCVAMVGFADVNAAREQARNRNHMRRNTKERLKIEKKIEALDIVGQVPPMPPENLPSATVIAPVFRHHGKKPEAPQKEEEKATGTDGVTSLDKMMTWRSERLKDDEV